MDASSVRSSAGKNAAPGLWFPRRKDSLATITGIRQRCPGGARLDVFRPGKKPLALIAGLRDDGQELVHVDGFGDVPECVEAPRQLLDLVGRRHDDDGYRAEDGREALELAKR